MLFEATCPRFGPRRVTATFEPGEVKATAAGPGATRLVLTLDLAVPAMLDLLRDGDAQAALGAAVAVAALRAHTPEEANEVIVPYEVEVPAGESAVWTRVAAVDLAVGDVFRFRADGEVYGPWKVTGPSQVVGESLERAVLVVRA